MRPTIEDEVAAKLDAREKLRDAAVDVLAEAVGPDTLGEEIKSLLQRARDGGPLPGELVPHRETFAALDAVEVAAWIKERAKQTE